MCKIIRIIMLICVCLYANSHAESYDSDSMSESWWIENFLSRANGSQVKAKNLSNLKQYFITTKGCNYGYSGDKCCMWSDGEKLCFFTLLQPLKFSANLTLTHDIAENECVGDVTMGRVLMQGDLHNATLSLNGEIKASNLPKELDEKIYKQLPQWFKAGLAGTVTFQAELELSNVKENLLADFAGNTTMQDVAIYSDVSACGSGIMMNVKNVNIMRLIESKPYDRAWYEEQARTWSFPEWSFIPNTTDTFINVRDKPNGKVIAQIQVKEWDKMLVFNLERLQNRIPDVNGWQRVLRQTMPTKHKDYMNVLYFPPNVTDATKATQGYIHTSQIKPNKSE